MSWRVQLEKSMDTFDRLVRKVMPRLLPGEIIRTEGSIDEIAQLLDKRIGIDAMVDQNGVIYGLGSRIQYGVDYRTFTIRSEHESGHITELEKLRNAIKYDAMRPHYTLQAYVIDDALHSIAIARTKDIIDYIDHHECPIRRAYDKDSGRWAQFVVVDWKKMQGAGYNIKVMALPDRRDDLLTG